MTLNRNTQPPFQNIDSIKLIEPEKTILDNSIPLYSINSGTQDVLKIDLSFEAGMWYQSKPLIAGTVNEMLSEGTTSMSSMEIAEKLDYFGAFIQANPSKDFAGVTLFTLKKYLPETISILEDIIKNPIFPEHELINYTNKRKQTFQIEMEKVSNLARRKFNEQLFGKEHPYGKNQELLDYDSITQTDLIDFHNRYYNSANCKIIVSGRVDSETISIINMHFGNINWKKKNIPAQETFSNTYIGKKEEIIIKEDVTQSAIRIGKQIITKHHPDYPKLEVVNTILGGYFGSRLMKTIREDKGYTYGISSFLVTLKNAGFFVIGSEVGSDVTKNAVDDIFIEIKKLRESFVSKDELEIVKNFMVGDLMRSFDGPFDLAQSYQSIIEMDIDYNFFNRTIDAIKSITPEEVKTLANTYLDESTMIKTIAGKY